MKIFNKQRMSFLKNKQIQKYIVYAIGEILLVIIGILIALGINKWNHNNQLKHANIELQNKVAEQLNLDIKHVENFQKELDTLQETYLKVLGRNYDKSKVNNNGMLSTVLFEVNTLALDQHVINLIDNAELDKSNASKELIEINSMYKRYMKNMKDMEQIIYSKIKANLEEIERTQPWYTDLITDFVCRNDCINYLLHNENHKSRIASLRFLYINGYGDLVRGFRHELTGFKESLQNTIKH